MQLLLEAPHGVFQPPRRSRLHSSFLRPSNQIIYRDPVKIRHLPEDNRIWFSFSALIPAIGTNAEV